VTQWNVRGCRLPVHRENVSPRLLLQGQHVRGCSGDQHSTSGLCVRRILSAVAGSVASAVDPHPCVLCRPFPETVRGACNSDDVRASVRKKNNACGDNRGPPRLAPWLRAVLDANSVMTPSSQL